MAGGERQKWNEENSESSGSSSARGRCAALPAAVGISMGGDCPGLSLPLRCVTGFSLTSTGADGLLPLALVARCAVWAPGGAGLAGRGSV